MNSSEGGDQYTDGSPWGEYAAFVVERYRG